MGKSRGPGRVTTFFVSLFKKVWMCPVFCCQSGGSIAHRNGIRQVMLAVFLAIGADAEFQVGIVVLRLATDLALMDSSRAVHDRAAEFLTPAEGFPTAAAQSNAPANGASS